MLFTSTNKNKAEEGNVPEHIMFIKTMISDDAKYLDIQNQNHHWNLRIRSCETHTVAIFSQYIILMK